MTNEACQGRSAAKSRGSWNATATREQGTMSPFRMALRNGLVAVSLMWAVACGGRPVTADTTPAEGGAGGEPSAAADATQTARYRWTECGRIGPRAPAWDARYAADGSLLVLDEAGQVLGYDTDDSTGRVLLQAAPPTVGSEDLASTILAISAEGRTLALWNATDVHVYAAPSGKPIGRNSGSLEAVAALDIDRPSNGHGGVDGQCPIAAMLSPDGAWFASFGQSAVCLWDVSRAELATAIAIEHDYRENLVLTFSGAGDALLVLSGKVLTAYTLDGQAQGSIDVPSYFAVMPEVAFSKDPQTVFGWADHFEGGSRLDAVDVSTGAIRWSHELDTRVESLTSNTMGYVLASRAGLYNIADGTQISADAGVEGFPADLSPDGRRQAAVGSGWISDSEIETGRLANFYGASDRAVTDLTMSRDGRYLLSMGNSPFVWELDEDFESSRTVAGVSAADLQWNGALSPAGDSFVLSGSEVLVWDRKTLRKRHADLKTSFAGRWRFSPDGDLLAGVADDEHVAVLDAATLQPVASFPSPVIGGEAAFSPDGKLLATSRVDLFDRESGELLWSKPVEKSSLESGYVEFSPDGKELLASGGCECEATRYEALTGEVLDRVPEISGRPSYSPDGAWIVARGRLVHLASRSVIEYAPDATTAVFTAQGRIVAAEADGSLVLYCRSDE